MIVHKAKQTESIEEVGKNRKGRFDRDDAKQTSEYKTNRLDQGAQAIDAEAIIELQQTLGNASVQRLLKSRTVQAKLTVNPPDDQYEREADAVAAAFARTPNSQIQRHKDEEKIQTKSVSGVVPEVSEDMEARLNAASSGGQPLPESLRTSLEPQLGHDFSGVRLHTDPEANRLSGELQAKAFTTGQDVFFAKGAYQPDSESGRSLIGHEIAHVVQQGAAPGAGNLDKSDQPAETSVLHLKPEVPGKTEGPPKTTKDPKEIAEKVIKALMETETGKKVKEKLMEAATSEEGIATLSILAVPTLTTMFANKMEVPEALVDLVPKVAKIELGKDIELSFQPIYKGNFGEKPKELGGMVNFTVSRW